MATLLLRARNGPFEQAPAKPAGAQPRVDPHALDQRTPAAPVREVRNERQLQDADDLAVGFDDDELVVRVGVDGGEGLAVAGWQRRLVLLALRSEQVVGEQPHDVRDVVAGRPAKHTGRWPPSRKMLPWQSGR